MTEDNGSSGTDNRIRVCVMIPKFHIGGAEVQVMGLLRNIDRSMFAVHLCLFGHGVVEMEEEASSLVEEIYYLDFRWRYLPVAFLKLVKYLQDGRFDVLHAHLAYADLIGRIAAWLAGVPVRITTEHGKGLWKSGFQVMIEQTMNRITDMRVCVSRDILRIRKEREHTDDSKLVYIPNAVNPSSFGNPRRNKTDIMEEFGWDPAAPLVLSIGRVVEAKNYPLLVRAVSVLSKKMPEVKCLIAGEGRCSSEVETAVGEAGLETTVCLAGSRNDIADLLGAADLFVLSSDREGLPVTLLEAMASGTPIVSTDVGGISEAVSDRESALLVPPGDASALAAAMEDVLSDSVLSARLTEKARGIVKARFSISSTSMEVQKIYEKLYREKRQI
ncbi:MAG: glycosyltransferase [Bacteroidales bacterium]|nr:glycosyltransferase [Candidatus Latescibacterota bacterium]